MLYKTWQFWLVGLFTGFFGGLLTFLLLFLVNLLVVKEYSYLYLFVYLAPLFFLWFSCLRLRNNYAQGVLSFGSGFRLSLLTGLILVSVLSLAIYFVYTYLNNPTLEFRINRIETDLVSKEAANGLQSINSKRQFLREIMSPAYLAIVHAIVNLSLLPVYAFLIAIFARRKNRFLD
ncbi:MAG: DUF4199 domain-containing protein [Bacteroidales bacterium]|nr:DUF4199 domain-containing protein [Bacteroidales bacterium]